MKSLNETECNGSIRSYAAIDEAFDRRIKLIEQSFDQYHTYLHSYLYGLCGHWQNAEDVLQELWKDCLYKMPEKYISQFGILRHRAFQLYVDDCRKRKPEREFLTNSLPENLGAEVGEYDCSEEAEEKLKQDFWDELPKIDLTDTQKECIWLKARFSYTYDEISAKLAIPRSTACDWVAQARTKIKNALER